MSRHIVDDEALAAESRTRKVRNTNSPADQYAAIIAAAAAEFTEVGVRRANVDKVAKRAGVSRSTLYRRFPNKEALLLGVTHDTYETYMDRLIEAIAGLGPGEAVVEAFTFGAAMIADDPLMQRLVHTDNEMGPVTTSVNAKLIDSVAKRVAEVMRSAGAQMPQEDLLAAVETHVRLVLSFLQTPPVDEERPDPERARAYAEKFLAPMVW